MDGVGSDGGIRAKIIALELSVIFILGVYFIFTPSIPQLMSPTFSFDGPTEVPDKVMNKIQTVPLEVIGQDNEDAVKETYSRIAEEENSVDKQTPDGISTTGNLSREEIKSHGVYENKNIKEGQYLKAVHTNRKPSVAIETTSRIITDRRDEDGLPYNKEVAIGTDPTIADTTGDGFTDGYAYKTEGLSATKPNILVQVSYTEDVNVEAIRNAEPYLKEVLGSNVVENPTGKTGFNIKYVVDEEPTEVDDEVVYLNEYHDEYAQKSFDKKGKGYFHIFVAPKVSIERGRVGGVTTRNGMLIGTRESGEQMAHLILHELGHKMGLVPSEYRAIDSREVGWETYPSVMSYVPPPCLDNGCTIIERSVYSAGPPFNDWKHMYNHYDENAPDRSKLPHKQQLATYNTDPKLIHYEDEEREEKSDE